jgi:2-dehydropantoate 2-reductase
MSETSGQTPVLPWQNVKLQLVVGAGAIGCWVGAQLIRAGLSVAFLARAEGAKQLAAGLLLSDYAEPNFQLRADQYAVYSDWTALTSAAERVEMVLLAVKSTATAELAALLAKHLPHVPVFSLQNGVENVAALRAVGLTVVPGMVPFNVSLMFETSPAEPATTQTPSTHWHRGTQGLIAYETPKPGAKGDAIRAWFADVQARGVVLQAYEELLPVQWGKLILNLNNPINALSNLPLVAQLSDRSYRLARGPARASSRWHRTC